jgi:hypothetical protein
MIFFMQAGQLYYSGQGYNVWADSESSYQVRYFDVDYVEGHDYAYVIAYYGGGDWILFAAILTLLNLIPMYNMMLQEVILFVTSIHPSF